MNGAVRPAAPTGRFEAIDAARGIAVLSMIAVHFVGTEGGVTPLEHGATWVVAGIEHTMVGLFCVVAGISWTIQGERAGVTPAFRRYLAGRALVLGLFGVLFHVTLWTTEILVPFALMMALSLLVLDRGPRTAAVAAVALIAAAPIVTLLVGEYATTDWTESGLHAADGTLGWATLRYLAVNGNYPLLSWMAFPLMGMVLWSNAGGSRTSARRWCLGAVGVAVVVLAMVTVAGQLGEALGAMAPLLAHRWTPTSAPFLVGAGAWSFAVIAGFWWWRGAAPLPRALLPLVLLGRASLSHYVLHIAGAYALLRLWYPDEDWAVTVGLTVMAAYLLLTIPLTVLWFRRFSHGPLELLWAQASRRPASRPSPDPPRPASSPLAPTSPASPGP